MVHPAEHHYAVMADDGTTIENVVVCDNPDYATEQGWQPISWDLNPTPWIGWTWDGANWNPPPDEP